MKKLKKTNYESRHTIQGFAKTCYCGCYCVTCSCVGPDALKVGSNSSQHGHGTPKATVRKK